MEKVRGKKITSYSILVILLVLIALAIDPYELMLALPEHNPVRLNHEEIVMQESVGDEPVSSMTFSECNVFGINKVINDYYDAYIMEGDDEILKVMDTFGDMDIEKRSFAQQNVEQYMNIRCYYTEASIDGAYLVVSYGYAKYYNINTTIPEIGMFFVRMNSSGNYYICNRDISNEVSAYNQMVFEMKTVTELKENAMYELESACEVDMKLREFVQNNIDYFGY